MAFLYPIRFEELVALSASVNAARHTSMEVVVRVDAENPRRGEVRYTNTAFLTMVALNDRDKPVQVPPLIATTPRSSGECAKPSRAAPTGWQSTTRSCLIASGNEADRASSSRIFRSLSRQAARGDHLTRVRPSDRCAVRLNGQRKAPTVTMTLRYPCRLSAIGYR